MLSSGSWRQVIKVEDECVFICQLEVLRFRAEKALVCKIQIVNP